MKSPSLYSVMTNESTDKENEDDEVILNIRISRGIREEFRVAAKMKGSSMSGLLHQFVIKSIREEKALDPSKFEKLLTKNSAPPRSASRKPSKKGENEMPEMTFEELQQWRAERDKQKKEKKK